MSRSNYPNGFPTGVLIRGVPVEVAHPGAVFWVNGSSVPGLRASTGSDTGKGTYMDPFATIDYAIGRCVAGRGDIIMVMPGHTETISAAGSITADVAGVAIIGLGTGTARPTLSYTTAVTASLLISAANVTVSNILASAAFADVTQAINVTGVNATLLDVEAVESGANLNFVDIVSATGADNTADGLHIERGFSSAIDAAINSFVQCTGDVDRLTVLDSIAVHEHANALAFIQCATGKDLTNVNVQRNRYTSQKTSGDLLIDNDTTANSGIVAHNLVGHLDTAGEVMCDCDGVYMFENYGTGVITASGYLLPAADS